MTGETILITRPAGDEETFTDALHEHGYRVIHEPLTSIVLDHTQRVLLWHALESDPDAIIVTSRHGVHALAMLSELRDGYLICVGEATANIANSLGFTRVHVAGGNVEKLVTGILSAYDEGSCFVYISGEHISADIDVLLASGGMQVQRLVLYEAVAAEALSDILIEHLKRRQIDAVTFLSQRAAQIFMSLLAKAKMQEAMTSLQAFCLSETIASALIGQPWQHVHVTDEATLASLGECIDNAFHTRG